MNSAIFVQYSVSEKFCFFVMSVVLGDWLIIPFATVPRHFASSFDGISLVLINHGLMLVVCILNHLNHWLYLAKLKDIVHIGNEKE